MGCERIKCSLSKERVRTINTVFKEYRLYGLEIELEINTGPELVKRCTNRERRIVSLPPFEGVTSLMTPKRLQSSSTERRKSVFV